MREPETRLEVDALVIRSPVALDLVHAHQELARDVPLADRIECACDTAHVRV
jgi:hypothetical protein